MKKKNIFTKVLFWVIGIFQKKKQEKAEHSSDALSQLVFPLATNCMKMPFLEL